MVGIEKDGWRAEPLPADLQGDAESPIIAAVCTYCEADGKRVFLCVDIDPRMKPYWYCLERRHRFPHSDDLERIAGCAFARQLAAVLQQRQRD